MSSSLTKGLRRSTSRSSAKKSSAKTAKRAVKTKPATKPKAKRAAAAKSTTRKTATKSRPSKKAVAAKRSSKAKNVVHKTVTKKAPVKKAAPSRVKKTQKVAAARAVRPAARAVVVPQPTPRQPTQDESAALVAFERAHKEFVRGRFAESRNQFRILLDKFSQVSEVAARARTYLAFSE